MNKEENYKLALSLIEENILRNSIVETTRKMENDRIKEYINTEGICRAMDNSCSSIVGLIGLEELHNFLTNKLELFKANKELEEAYQDGGAVKELHI